jgi:hypothetical protein
MRWNPSGSTWIAAASSSAAASWTPDAIGALEARIEALKAGENYRSVLTPTGTQQRTDRPLLLRGSGSPRSNTPPV